MTKRTFPHFKRLISILFFSMSFLSLAEDGSPVTVSKDRVMIDVPQIKWRQDRFLKAEPSGEKTPDGENAIMVSINAEGAPPAVIMNSNPGNFKDFALIDGVFESISFWMKPDNSGMVLTPTFKVADQDNPYHTGSANLQGKEWRKVVFTSLWSKENRRLKLEDVEYFIFQVSPMGVKKGEFLIGPVSIDMNTGGMAMLAPLKSAVAVKTATPPKLDGLLDDDCWKNIRPIKDFIWREKAGEIPSEVKICFDDGNIYFAAKQDMDTSKLLQERKTRDMNVWMDDSFQIFVNPENDERTFRQFIVNSLNVKQDLGVWFDQVKDDFTLSGQWDGKWESAVHIEPGGWSVEVAIPFSDLGKDDPNKSLMGLQLAFENPSVSNDASWAPTIRFPDPVNFGILLFAGQEDHRFAVESAELSFSRLAPPELRLQIPSVEKGTVMAFLGTCSGKVFQSTGRLLGGKAKLLFHEYAPENGIHRLTVWAKSENGGDALCGYKVGPVQLARPVPFGELVLCPRAKELRKGEGVFQPETSYRIFASHDAMETALKIKNDLTGYMQLDLRMEQSELLSPCSICIAENVQPDNMEAELASIPRKDGYVMDIRPGRIMIRGNTPAGLFYASITLSQMERCAYVRNESFIAGGFIKDWPSIPFRIWENWAQGLLLNRTKATKQEIFNEYKDVLDRYAVGSKFNCFGLNFADSVAYERPENRKVNLYPNAEFLTMPLLAELAEHCRKNYVEFIPCIHGPSHSLWMTIPYPELVMPGYSNWDADPTNPKFFDMYFSVCDEISDAVAPKYFSPWLDEWWHQSKGELSTTYNGKEKRDIYLETVTRIHDYHKKAGRRMIMFSDMLQREHNGGKPYDNYLNMDKLPKDIIMANWSGGCDALKTFAELGHDTWYLGNSFSPIGVNHLPKNDKICGFGTINYEFLNPEFGYGCGPMLRAADYAWNFGDGFEMSLEDWMMECGRNIMSMYSVMPNPSASHEFNPLDISSQCNDSFFASRTGLAVKDIPQGLSEIGFIPTMIACGKENNCILGTGKAVSIAIGEKASSVIFLHTQACPDGKRKEFSERSSARESASGTITGFYDVVYNDGSSLAVPISNGRNCGNWLPYPGRCTTETQNKYISDVRYVWEGAGGNGGKNCLFQYEWVNPNPDLPIKEIRFSSAGKEAEPVLFAVTLRKPLQTTGRIEQ
jgi:hypothetical protein